MDISFRSSPRCLNVLRRKFFSKVYHWHKRKLPIRLWQSSFFRMLLQLPIFRGQDSERKFIFGHNCTDDWYYGNLMILKGLAGLRGRLKVRRNFLNSFTRYWLSRTRPTLRCASDHVRSWPIAQSSNYRSPWGHLRDSRL